MQQLVDSAEITRLCTEQRRQGRRVGFVPTMGYLHQGHLALVARARELCDFVVVSIFVNPAQFAPGEDLDRYPRDLPADLARCREGGVDLVFTPEAAAIYPPGFQTYVTVEQLSQGLCGARRSGHFRGVCTVVCKLLNIVGSCLAVFGQKDYQQLQVIRRMVQDLALPAEVLGHPTVREQDGLALSSRNAYLAPAERAAAGSLYQALCEIRQRAARPGGVSADEALALAREIIEAQGGRVDYIEARDAETLQPCDQLRGGGEAVVALAVFFGQTRLIDNMVI